MNKDVWKRRMDIAARVGADLQEIAEALTGEWSVVWPEHDPHNFPVPANTLRDADGRELFIIERWNTPERWEISGSGWPEYLDSDGRMRRVTPRDLWNPEAVTPTCTCAKKRGPEAVAKDIERKILPELAKVIERCKAIALERGQYTERFNSELAALNQALGNQRSLHIPGEKHPAYFEYRSPDSVKVDMSAAAAVRFIEMMKEGAQ